MSEFGTIETQQMGVCEPGLAVNSDASLATRHERNSVRMNFGGAAQYLFDSCTKGIACIDEQHCWWLFLCGVITVVPTIHICYGEDG